MAQDLTTLSTVQAPSRGRIACALGVTLAVPVVLLVFAGVLILVALVHVDEPSPVAPFWGSFGVLGAVMGAVLLGERQRAFGLAHALIGNRTALQADGVLIDGVRVRHDTPLVRYLA